MFAETNPVCRSKRLSPCRVEFWVLPEAFTIHYPHYIKWNVPYMG